MRQELVREHGRVRSRFRGLVRCGSVWTCPVCALAICAERAEEVTQAVTEWGHHRVGLATFTFRHTREHRLKVMQRGIADAYRRLTRGKPWERLREKYGIRHTLRKLEVTWGPKHGWHPHEHVLYFFDRKLSPDELAELERELVTRWIEMVKRELGDEYEPTTYAGVDVSPSHQSDYIAKLGLEMTSELTKEGKGKNCSPWQILANAVRAYERGADDFQLWYDLWREYAEAMHGRRQLEWSRGLKQAVGIGERSDQDVVNAEDGAVVVELVGFYRRDVWYAIRDVRGLRIGLLEAAERGGEDAVVEAVIDGLGMETCERLWPTDVPDEPDHPVGDAWYDAAGF